MRRLFWGGAKIMNLKDEIVEKQHFVPQVYLRAWLNSDERLECYDKEKKCSFPNKTSGIANIHFFYETNVLTEKQLIFMYNAYIEEASGDTRDEMLKWFALFTEKSILQKFCQDNSLTELEKKFRYNSEEKMYCSFEGKIPQWREAIENENKDFWTKDNEAEFIFWIMLQYVRTKKMQELFFKIKEKMKDKTLIENAQNLYRWLSATKLKSIILNSGDMKIIVLRNKTDIPFITGDQPVVNIHAAHIEPEKMQYNDFEFFYPLSPTIAIFLSPKNCYSNWQNIDIDEEHVIKYNSDLECLCDRFVYRKL